MRVLNLTKMVTLIFMSATLIFSSSCEKDDGDASIIGTWVVGETTMEITVDGVSLFDYLVNELEFSIEEAEASLAENLEMSASSGSVEFEEEGVFTSYWDDSDPEIGAWTLEDDVLTITAEGDEEGMVFDVITLSDTKLTIELTMTNTNDMNQDGEEEIMITKLRMPFTK